MQCYQDFAVEKNDAYHNIYGRRRLAGAIRIELISLVLETKAQPLYQTPKQRSYYITKKSVCQLFLPR